MREPQRQTSGLLADRLSFSAAVIELSAGPVLCSSARSVHIGGVPTSSGDGANLGGGPPPHDVSLVFSTRFRGSSYPLSDRYNLLTIQFKRNENTMSKA